jgi:small subunit ribosomal protein S8
MNIDPIADLLTRLRNAGKAQNLTITLPSSKMKVAIAEVLKSEGYITGYEVSEVRPNIKELTISLKYADGVSVIEGCKRVSKLSCRTYSTAGKIPFVRGGLGISIVTTSNGVLSDRVARKQNVGGEVLAQVW